MSNKLATVRNTALVSRWDILALAIGIVIDGTIHASGELLQRGVLLGKIVATGKYRAYAEGLVADDGAFSNAAKTFTLDPADEATKGLLKNFRLGDVVEGTDGTALGTIATFNPATGEGTLAANSTSNLATGKSVRIAKSVLALADGKGKLLTDEVISAGSDMPATGFFEGFFVKSLTTVTAAALSEMGGIVTDDSNEIRLK